jgi:hypothetical protein
MLDYVAESFWIVGCLARTEIDPTHNDYRDPILPEISTFDLIVHMALHVLR